MIQYESLVAYLGDDGVLFVVHQDEVDGSPVDVRHPRAERYQIGQVPRRRQDAELLRSYAAYTIPVKTVCRHSHISLFLVVLCWFVLNMCHSEGDTAEES